MPYIPDRLLFVPVKSPKEYEPEKTRVEFYKCICSDYPIHRHSIIQHKKTLKHKHFINEKFGDMLK